MLRRLFGFGWFGFFCRVGWGVRVWGVFCLVGFLFWFVFVLGFFFPKTYYLFYLVCYVYVCCHHLDSCHESGRQLIEIISQMLPVVGGWSKGRILERIKSFILVPKNIRSMSVSLQLLIRDVSASLESSDHLWHVFFGRSLWTVLKTQYGVNTVSFRK